MSDELGTIYLLCFDRPGPGGARHYLGWSSNVEARLAAHREGRGAKLTRELKRLGIGFEAVQVWHPATRADERRLKKRHQHARLCPKCRPAALSRHSACERDRRRKAPAVLNGRAAK